MTAEPFADLLAGRASDDRPGLLFEGRTWSWREYVEEARSAASWLDAFGRPLHAAVLGDNSPGLLFLIGAAALSEHVVVALNPTRSVAELERDARATRTDLVLWDEPYGEAAREVAQALGVPHCRMSEARDPGEPKSAPGELVMLIFTSGTSGRPRAVRITQRKLAVPGTNLAALLGADDAVYCSMPLFHSGALMAAFSPAVASGARLVVRRRFSASAVLPDVREHGCTYLHYVGKALSYVLATPEQPGDADGPLKIAFGNEGGATAVRRFGERFGCYVIDAFGSTETAISITPDPSGPKGCLGRLPEGVEIRDPATGRRSATAIIEHGRLANPDEAIGELVNVQGMGLFDGYFEDEEADRERIRDGAFWSGDLAYADADGFVFFAGRGSERLRVDGENLAVAPIEAVLREFEGVVEAAVYPVPDAAAGDQVMAALVLAAPFDPGAFQDFLAGRKDLGSKAIPRYIRVCGELPQTPSNKVLKRHLVSDAWLTEDPIWVRDGGYRRLTARDREAIHADFVRQGRQHLLESAGGFQSG
ncbi:AMP-binding protein [Nonomuraea soli]|uniref:Fatty-acyl-CoA synthase n=1 Tax=Nonomuraea soli TaxID=1032476 RepID=A0A7W0HSM0_9ACTN|nr:AMP-binding protein [Nonomuraea soli]MBA2894174.1 fatty-acyl-CoA synthase [Nonomuraea soli]